MAFGPPLVRGCTCLCAHVRDSMLRDPLLATIPLATERGRVRIMGGDWVICDAQNFRQSRPSIASGTPISPGSEAEECLPVRSWQVRQTPAQRLYPTEGLP